MEIEAVRDWVIVIFGIVGIGAAVVLLVLLVSVYRKVASILDSIQETVDIVRDTSSEISNTIIQPLAKARDFLGGIGKALKLIFQ